MNCTDFYDIAKSVLADGSATEAELRTAIGRAYYSAFLYARDAAGITTPDAGVHRETADYYTTRMAQVGNSLRVLRTKRNTADYKLTVRVGRRDAEEALSHARTVLSRLRCSHSL